MRQVSRVRQRRYRIGQTLNCISKQMAPLHADWDKPGGVGDMAAAGTERPHWVRCLKSRCNAVRWCNVRCGWAGAYAGGDVDGRS